MSVSSGLYERAKQAIRGFAARGHAPLKTALSGEPIRLVIWDLDDTFWRGTLTEGGIEYIQANHDTVITLAKRGILSSICSRNDHASIETLLRERGLWDYFVFPIIDWTSKGGRLKNIVETSQLRAATVLFIDDNPMNRAEAERFVEQIRVADPSVLSSLLDDPLLKGKDDRGLKRLSQYKLLERRSLDLKVADDNATFLRASGIKVSIEHNIDAHLDRAIELINRTNQLNFTKSRLPEDQNTARDQLRELLSDMPIQAGLVRVTDRYGDYGFCGLYVQHRWMHFSKPTLIHFCFSCRTLGMEVETWLYRRLRKPEIEIRGEVLTDINSEKEIDWIEFSARDDVENTQAQSYKVPRVFTRGGCEMVAISHYFNVLTNNIVSEFAFIRDGLEVRFDHSQMLKLAVQQKEPRIMQSLQAIGFHQSDFETAFVPKTNERCVYVLGFWAQVFRHTSLDFRALVNWDSKIGVAAHELLALDLATVREKQIDGWVLDALSELQKNYVYEGSLPLDITRDNILELAGTLPPNSLVILIGCPEKLKDKEGVLHDVEHAIKHNKTLSICAEQSNRIKCVYIDMYVKDNRERHAYTHFARDVYFRMFIDIKAEIDKWMSTEELLYTGGNSAHLPS